MAQDNDTKKSFETLKNLLVKPEKDKIQKIENRLDDPLIRAQEISQSLPHAISMSIMDNDQISRAMEPVIDASLKASVKENPKAIADAIFPALGPGIRKAITSTIMGMIQSLNQVLNHSFSIQGFKWRFEAFKTRRPFAEVVLLNTLVFQVEQIFLIHKSSGIVLEHVVSKDAIIQDPDLVSAMLTAIQDFVKDSFTPGDEEGLETLRTGSDRSIWIEQGNEAILAAVIRGTPPVDLRNSYKELLEDIHLKAGSALEEFNGDPSPFAVFREQLKDGLHSQEKKETKKVSPWLWLIFIVLSGLLIQFSVNRLLVYQSWSDYLKRLKSEKGIIVLSTTKKEGVYQIKGLKDPLAKNPKYLLTLENKNRFVVDYEWQPYFCLDTDFIRQRAHSVLSPPTGIELILENNTLIAKGRAPQSWISRFKTLALTVPGITAYKTEEIVNTDSQRLNRVVNRLRQNRIYFQNNSTRFKKGEEEKLDQIVQTIKEIQALQSNLNNMFQITILGHTDSSGTEKLNLKLSRNRAEKVMNELILKGIHPGILNFSGIGPKAPLILENKEDDRQLNRAVSFKIFYMDQTKGQST